MKMSQYIYTSWKNGNSSEKGYMIYSKSQDITLPESNAIKYAMQYVIPKGMNPTPTIEDIKEYFPKSFAYFILPSGRGCIAQSTYLGKDYSGRFGNYIIYAGVFELSELEKRPYEFFAADFIKDYMTEEELEAESPVPPLQVIKLDDNFEPIISEKDIVEFITEREEEVAVLLSMVLDSGNKDSTFYLRDNKDNLIMWISALQRILPLSISKNLTFSTYVGRPEFLNSQLYKDQNIKFVLACFNDEMEFSNNNFVDFISGKISNVSEVSEYVRDIVSSATYDFDEIDEFNDYIEDIGLSKLTKDVELLYKLYKITKSNEFEYDENIIELLYFSSRYLSESDRIDFLDIVLRTIKSNNISISVSELFEIWLEILKIAPGLLQDLYYYITDNIFEIVSENYDYKEILVKFENLEKNVREGYLEYFVSLENRDIIHNYISDNYLLNINMFYKDFLIKFYSVPDYFYEESEYNNILENLIKNMIINIENSDGLFELLFEKKLLTKPSFYIEMINYIYGNIDKIGKKDYFYKKYLDFTYRNEELFSQIRDILINNDETRDFLVEIEKVRIQKVSNPMEYFWNYYKNYYKIVSEDITADVAFFAIKREKNLSDKELFMVIDNIEGNILNSEKLRKLLISRLNKVSLKNLDQLFSILFEKLLDIDKDCEILNLRLINVSNNIKDKKLTLEDYSIKINLDLRNLSTKDYEYYVDNYIEDYILVINDYDDINTMVKLFNNDNYTYFTSKYVDLLKLSYKNRISDYLLIKETAIYLLKYGYEHNSKFYDYVVAYFRSFNSKELDNLIYILSSVIEENSLRKLREIFSEKNSIKTKISMFFKK